MKPTVIDLSGDIRLGLHSMEAALAAAKATEKRAAILLALAKAAPKQLELAQGIYLRAGLRAKKIQDRLDLLVGRGFSEHEEDRS